MQLSKKIARNKLRELEGAYIFYGGSRYRQILYPYDLEVAAKVISKEINRLKKEKHIDAIACCGISGIVVASAVSIKANLPIVIIRKPNEQRHDETEMAGFSFRRYVIIDDFIDTGATINHIINRLITNCDARIEVAEIILWRERTYTKYNTVIGEIKVCSLRSEIEKKSVNKRERW